MNHTCQNCGKVYGYLGWFCDKICLDKHNCTTKEELQEQTLNINIGFAKFHLEQYMKDPKKGVLRNYHKYCVQQAIGTYKGKPKLTEKEMIIIKNKVKK